ncbi:MAG: SDR family oxidoreductase [Acidobacteriota bacterium]|nr:SDR family oxidoreductase [Acidobacteriota bacterium]
MKTKDLSEQTALVTGGATGIGRAFTEALLANGIGAVIIASRRQSVLDEAARELNAKFGDGRVLSYAFDVRNRAETENLVRFALEKRGAVDVLISNSGLAVPETVTEITDAGWNTVLETNLRGAMWLVQMLLPRMFEQDFGDVVNVSSQAGKNGYADVPSYCASKFGLLGFAESVRDDVKKRGANIRVFNFCPGLVDVETPPEEAPRAGFIHVRNMAKTLIYALSLDRDVILEDINIYSR